MMTTTDISKLFDLAYYCLYIILVNIKYAIGEVNPQSLFAYPQRQQKEQYW